MDSEKKNIKFRKTITRSKFTSSAFWRGKKNGFVFEVTPYNSKYYVIIQHSTKGIRFNSLWQSITFETTQDAFDWCDNFNANNFNCLGKDFNQPKQ